MSKAKGPAAPPHSPAAERAVLGAVFVNASAIREIGEKLAPEDFWLESHRSIFTAMRSIEAEGKPIDFLLVSTRLRELDLEEVAGGGPYLMELASSVPAASNVRHYVEIVKKLSIQRAVLGFSVSVGARAQGEVEDIETFVDQVAREAMALSGHGTTSRTVLLSEALDPAIDQLEKRMQQEHKGGVTGVPTGFHALNRMTAGWQPSDLIILAARPGMGKTAFVLNLLVNAAKDKRRSTKSVIFSLEMSSEQLATRIWCSAARVPMEKVRTGDLDSRTFEALLTPIRELSELGIYIDDTPAISINEMMRKCRQLQQQHGIGLIVIDYLQLMTAGVAGKQVTREQQISDISRNLKALAKELSVPVIALSQLNRSVESRTDKRPMLSDLRESGAIEQDADIILFLYRESYYDQMKGGSADDEAAPQAARSSSSDASITELIIAKHRSGPTGKVELNFHPSYTLFTNLPSDAPPPPDSENPS